jgi:Histidyl-tRNA synthetase
VWRGEKAQGGRFREFLQCDVDIVGSESVISDAEIIALMYQVTLALGFQNFLIKINSREILNALPFYLDFPSQNLDEVLRIVDKLDKIGERQVKSELEKLSYLNREKIKKLITLFNLKAKDNVELINLVQAKLSNEYSQVGFKKLKLLIGYLDAFGVPSDKWVFDLATVRGLSYYTGFVFEVVLLDLVEVGSIFSGGRYDGLSEKIGGNFLPAVGASLGFDRAFYALEKLGIIETTKIAQEPKVMVIYPEEKNALEAIKIVQLLRNNEISANIYLGKEKTLRGQLAYCLKNNYQVAIIVGEEEIQKKKVAVKIFKSYQQINVKIEDLPLVLKKELKS